MRASPSRFWLLLLPIGLAAGIYFGSGAARPNRLTILAVGQGSCAVFQNDGRTVLIDAGPSKAGSRLILPGLRRLGVGSIDVVLLSHPDSDHFGGLASVLDRYSVGRIVVPACFKGNPQLRDLPQSKVAWLTRSASIRIGDATLQVEAPYEAAPEEDNDGSMFVRITDGNAVAVLSGDAPIDVENRMVGRLPRWSAQVLAAGHHGSRTATGSLWLRTVRPSILAISCGRSNPYGHPHPSVLKAAAAARVSVARTDLEGDLVFDVGSSGFARVPPP